MRAKTAGKLPEDSKIDRFSKNDARYWLVPKRLFKDHGVADYSCRFSHQGKRAQVCLNTANHREAAKRAATVYAKVTTDGWQAGLALYRPQPQIPEAAAVTVGDLIAAAAAVSTARRQSLECYTKAFRRIVSEIKGISSDRKYVAKGGDANVWQRRVDAVELGSVTPRDVMEWKNRRLREVESDPLAKRRTIVTVNSLVRNARALFGKKILPFVEQSLSLAGPLPFEGVLMEKAPSMRYVSKLDPYALLAAAREQLAGADPEAFKALLLALVCGLRRSEIDNLLWRAFDFGNRILKVDHSEFHQLKSEDSAGVIDLDADTTALFRDYRTLRPRDLFVIVSEGRPSSQHKARAYRCDPVFKRLLAWLREHGVAGDKPLHTLRKEIGSIIAAEHGIFEASRYLRHSDIRITSAIYADKKKTVTPKAFAGLLGSGAK
ncbi:MAG: tyrosine-type recombinase/integrase [Verrucomicrobia bacterium]|nr:tyrosine-type recombinase/integrase [Verrucomicrobiota bacterium]